MDKVYNLADILPHNHPMILIDKFLDYSLEGQTAKASVTITKDKIFYDDDLMGVSPIVGIEYMAQTIGCYAYFMNGEKPPKVGFLLGTRSYKNSLEKFELGKTYTILVKQVFSDNQLVSFECFIYNESMECASAIVNVYQPQSDSDLNLENFVTNSN